MKPQYKQKQPLNTVNIDLIKEDLTKVNFYFSVQAPREITSIPEEMKKLFKKNVLNYNISRTINLLKQLVEIRNKTLKKQDLEKFIYNYFDLMTDVYEFEIESEEEYKQWLEEKK